MSKKKVSIAELEKMINAGERITLTQDGGYRHLTPEEIEDAKRLEQQIPLSRTEPRSIEIKLKDFKRMSDAQLKTMIVLCEAELKRRNR